MECRLLSTNPHRSLQSTSFRPVRVRIDLTFDFPNPKPKPYDQPSSLASLNLLKLAYLGTHSYPIPADVTAGAPTTPNEKSSTSRAKYP